MRKIILTIGTKSSTVDAESILKRVDFRTIISLYPELLSDPINCKPAAILKYLDNSEEDLIIGNAINELTDYNEIKKGLDARKIEITKVILKYPVYSLSASSEYKKQYQEHARWLDYSPEAAESIARDYVERLHLLVDTIEQDGIEVEVID